MRKWAAFLVVLACFAHAQPQFEPGNAPGQLRDAVVHADSGRIYAAAYDENQVWVIDPASRDRLAQVPVGKGPAALALSPDGGTLACVNRQDNSLSLIQVPSNEMLATIKVGEGPTAVAALSTGLFAVANTYGDTISLVDPARSSSSEIPAGAAAVPTGIAATGAGFAVIGRASALVSLFDNQGQSTGTVSLPAPAKDIVAASGRYCVATGAQLLVIDPASASITGQTSSAAIDLAADEAELYALQPGGQVERLDPSLKTLDSSALAQPALRLSASHGVVLALAPQTRSWQVWNGAALTAKDAAAPAPMAPDEPATVLQIAEATPSEPAAQPAAETVAEVPKPGQTIQPAADQVAPVVESTEPPIEVSTPINAQTPVEAAPEAVDSSTVVVSDAAADMPLAPRPGMVRKHPVRTDGVGVPDASTRPSAVPLRQLSRRTIADALVQPTEFGSTEAGFQAPDWKEPFRDIEFETMRSAPNAEVVDLQGKVRLRLGDMYFKAEEFRYDKPSGTVHAAGDIEITQQESVLRAEDFNYQIPQEGDLPAAEASPYAAVLTDQEREKQRLTLGHLQAKNVYIDEPTRTMSAESIDYDFGSRTGQLLHVHGQAGIYYYSAGNLRILGPTSMEGDDVWVTTCDRDPPHYKVRLSRAKIENGMAVGGSNARLQLGKLDTPFFLPRWRHGGSGDYAWTFDFDSGRRAELGYYADVGQRFELTPDFALGPRIFLTEKEGVGFGGDLDYDFSKSPASRLYRAKGELHGLYTTKDRGYLHFYHRYDYDKDLTVRVQAEQWSDEEFYKDFFYDRYRNRSTPRTFANVTLRKEDFIATGTVRANTHNWVNETERLPEATFHLLERPLADRLYLAFDSINGYNSREPYGEHGARSVNILRATYDWDPLPALAITPFAELEGSFYSKDRFGDSAATRFSSQVGITAQTRFHREYAGRWGFSAFKHVIVPSLTYSYQPDASLGIAESPRFDSLDNVFGRSRIESKIDNIFYGRDAETSEVWQVARLSLYQGNDLWNEIQKSNDYEFELDIRPRPWVGMQIVGERHDIAGDFTLYDDDFRGVIGALYDRYVGQPSDWGYEPLLGESFVDYDRLLAQVYYEQLPFDARVGFAYTETRGQVFNREVLYGLGYEINDKWGIGFEHRYDFEDGSLRSQTYEIRRTLHCWETALRVRDRESGFDLDLTFNIKAFPGTKVKF